MRRAGYHTSFERACSELSYEPKYSKHSPAVTCVLMLYTSIWFCPRTLYFWSVLLYFFDNESVVMPFWWPCDQDHELSCMSQGQGFDLRLPRVHTEAPRAAHRVLLLAAPRQRHRAHSPRRPARHSGLKVFRGHDTDREINPLIFHSHSIVLYCTAEICWLVVQPFTRLLVQFLVERRNH